MSDQPPADWYTDPEDSSQYRYWDGSFWTEHRAPRHTETLQGQHPDWSGLRPTGQLISGSFAVVRRLWRGLLLAAAASSAGLAIAVAGGLATVNRILDGQLDEILDRISEPGFDPNAPEQEAYFSSLTLDWTPGSFVPLAATALITLLVYSFVVTAVMRAVAGDLAGETPTLIATLRQSRQRTLRMMGVQLKVVASLLAAIIILAIPAIVSPLLLLLTVPAMLAFTVVWATVLQMAFVVAATGPAEPSIRCALRLVRGRFRGTLGRLLLVTAIVAVIAYGVGLPLTLATGTGEQPFHVVQLVNGTIAALVGWVATAATVIVYRDLGGESG